MMKLIALFLSIGMLHVSASSVAQSVTLSKQDASLKEVFDAINAQTGYDFVWSAKTVRNSTRIRVELRDQPLEKALQQVLKDLPLGYEIVDKTIVIKEAVPSSRSTRHPERSTAESNGSLLILALPEVRGKIVDSLGNPLSGASVRVLDAEGKRTSLQTQTDRNGEFVLRNVPEGATLEISFIGYVTQVVRVSANVGSIVLKASPSLLAEVMINKGYYTESKRLSTGNVARVTAEEIKDQPVLNPLQALQGRMAGVEIVQNSGVPGAGVKIQIRGRNSIRINGDYPLYVIDGVPISSVPSSSYSSLYAGPGIDPLNTLDMNMIESVEVLKDADATAIYGSRGANGVVLITTKKAKQEKVKLQVNAYTGFANVSKKLSLLNTAEYLTMRKEALANAGAEPASRDYDLTVWDTTRYTDWQQELLGSTSNMDNLQVSLTGGSNTTSFLLSGSLYNEGTVFPGDFRYRRISVRFDVNHSSVDQRFIINFGGTYGSDDNKLFNSGNTITSALQLPPNAPKLFLDNGELNWEGSTWTNPLATMNRAHTTKKNMLITQASISYALWKELKLKANLGYTTNQLNENIRSPKTISDPAYWSTYQSQSIFGTHAGGSWIVEPQITYNKAHKNSRWEALVGATLQSNILTSTGFIGRGFTSDGLLSNLNAANQVTSLKNNQIHYKYGALFGRFGYHYQEKYLFNATLRRDGSSRFGPDKRFANFAAIGAAWIFTNERFFQSSFLNHGKLRASYGTSGSDQIGDYGYLDSYSPITSPAGYRGAGGLYPTQLANPDYSWETNRKLETAIELGMLKDRVNLSASWFRNRSSNQLVGYPLPRITGFTSVQANLPAVVENTGWEFHLTSINAQRKRFHWTSSFNLTIPENRLVNYPNIAGSSYANSLVVGEPLTIRKLYQYTGLNPTTGNYEFLDKNGDGVFNVQDQVMVKNIGRVFYGGLSNVFQLRSVGLDFFFEFVKQNGMGYRSIFSPPGFGGEIGNQPVQVMERWKTETDQTDVQSFTQTNSSRYYNAASSTINYGDASFIRLKNISLSYQFPQEWTSRISMATCRLHVAAQNALTLSNYVGLDPQNPGSINLPALRVFTFGANFQF